jgi:Ni,Fe-hydrogenase I cytochrome b subunit
MTEENKERLSYPNEKRRLSDWVAMLIAMFFLLSFLTPYFYTLQENVKTSVSGYAGWVFMEDTGDLIHYSASFSIVSLIFSATLFLTGLVGLFIKAEERKKIFLTDLILLILKTASDITVCVLASKTSSNLQLDWGGYFAPVSSVILLAVYLAIELNFKDKNGLLIQKKDKKATSETK